MSNTKNAVLELMEYQKTTYDNVEKLFKKGNKAAIICPPGVGKLITLLKYILEHPDDRILYLSHRSAIKEYFYESIVRYIGGRTDDTAEELINEFGSMEKAAQSFIPNVKAMLYQTILGIGKKKSVDDVIAKLKPDLIVVEEMHHIKTKKNDSQDYVEDDEWELPDEQKNENIKEENEWGKNFKKFLDINPKAKLLGLSATPIREDGANVVERLFDNSMAMDMSVLEAMEAGITNPLTYVVPDFLEQEEMETLLQQIEKAEGLEKEKLKKKYDELVEKSSKALGIPELMKENIQEKNGKYIVFCKDIKDMEEKQKKAKEWFGKIEEEPKVYRVSSKHKDSKQQLNDFNEDESEHLKLLYCVGMIDEGVHLNNISGVILTAKTESRITYIQRIGRTMTSGKNKKPTIAIDLANNYEVLLKKLTREEYGYEITDYEALIKAMDWINEKNDGQVPNYKNPKSDKERIMAVRLARINNKYLKYAQNNALLEDLDETKKEEVESILKLGEEIILWKDYIELDEKDKEINKRINDFLDRIEIKGVRKDFRNLLLEHMSTPLKNAMEIEKWCETNYGSKPIWERKLPNSKSKNENERSLGQKLGDIRKRVTKKYEGIELDDIKNKEDRQIVEIVRRIDSEYGLGNFLKSALKIEHWCKEHYGDKPVWERNLPSRAVSNDDYEIDLGEKLKELKLQFHKKYSNIELEKIENEEDRRTEEIFRRLKSEYGLEKGLKYALEIENWCRENYGDKPVWERNLPNKRSEDKYENELGNKPIILG